MKQFLFLLMLLALVSLLSCSDSNDDVLGPGSEDQVQANQEQSAPSGAQTDVIMTGDGGDGDPWEDNGSGEGGGPSPIPPDPPVNDPPGGGPDTLPNPHIDP